MKIEKTDPIRRCILSGDLEPRGELMRLGLAPESYDWFDPVPPRPAKLSSGPGAAAQQGAAAQA